VSDRIGARPIGAEHTSFCVWAPRSARVEVQALPSDTRTALTRAATGYHHGVVRCDPGTRYRYVLDGAREWPDPASVLQPDGVHGPSEVVDLLAYPWRDAAFRPVPLDDAVLYELHVGTFTPGGTFTSAIAVLDDLVDLGVTAVEVMPVAQFPGARNWGYDGVFPFAVQASYGGPLGLQRFVDECHVRGLAVVLDVVYNHLGPEGNVLPEFAPYLTDRYHTPWGPAVNVDGADSDGVRHYFISNALQWFEDFHVDGLRLDAIHELIDRSAHPFLAELSGAIRTWSERSGRTAWLIAESADNDPRAVSPVELGGMGLRAQWNDDFHHAVHAALTAEDFGYYRDYQGGAADIAKAMAQGFVYQGQYSSFRRRRHGAPSIGVDPGQFVVFSQNHDQVGNRPDGARLAALVPDERIRLAAALVILAPGIPLLFMGEEYAETAPFAYFVDHGDPVLLDAVRQGRAGEHGRTPPEPLDPAAEETFCRCVLDPARRHQEGHREVWWFYRSLLALRAAEPALRHSSRTDTTAHADGDLLTLVRSLDGVTVRAIFNLSPSDAVIGLPKATAWEEILPAAAPPAEGHVALAAWQCRVFRSAPARVDPEAV
jgi:maltooligosyltrehalose trehalohydrolase